MLLRNLPEDILAAVIERCLDTSGNAAGDFKCNLPLLAVCRLWRRLAIPMVYTRVFVQYGDRPALRTDPLDGNPDDEEPTDAAVKTNLDLVAMVGCARAVKRVEIDVFCLANPFPGWREVIQRMRAVASKWRAVQLMVAMRPDPHHFDGHNVRMSRHTDDVAEVGDALATLMPDVRRLECEEVNHNPIAQSIGGYLASHYADQLRWFDSRHPIAAPRGCRFTGLKRFHVNHDLSVSHQFPQMASEELVDMRLVNGPPNHSWASFSTRSDSRAIEFTNLRRLYLAYFTTYREEGIAVRHRDGHPWKLHFPSLTSLHIQNSQRLCPLLGYAVFPPHMESIFIDMKSAAYQDHANVVLPATKRLSLCISSQYDGDSSGLPAVNHILENARGSEILELKICDPMLPVTPESITCTVLTRLEVWATTTVDTVLALIKKLQTLVELEFTYLNLDTVRTDTSVPRADDDTAVEPLHTSLRVLAINYDTWELLPHVAVALAKYVLLGIPTLTELSAPKIPRASMLDFVEAYAPRYPRLNDVKMKLNGEADSTASGSGLDDGEDSADGMSN